MKPVYALKAIDNCIRDIMNSNIIFGGKIIVQGDFRKVLPVIPRAPPAAVLDFCLKRSSVWNKFHEMQLMQHMRTNANEQDFRGGYNNLEVDFFKALLIISQKILLIFLRHAYVTVLWYLIYLTIVQQKK
ncbi:DNA helicase Pif1-like [Octopus vulgaris]|uniref:ATP-dependent DNA helicase n=1 Tax=Octopus vulgaris TaxID=6645 RepID=A0AA36AI63_OCTVU|nr:DNA helicase Pif1-like [Octopus vulgaris]